MSALIISLSARATAAAAAALGRLSALNATLATLSPLPARSKAKAARHHASRQLRATGPSAWADALYRRAQADAYAPDPEGAAARWAMVKAKRDAEHVAGVALARVTALDAVALYRLAFPEAKQPGYRVRLLIRRGLEPS